MFSFRKAFFKIVYFYVVLLYHLSSISLISPISTVKWSSNCLRADRIRSGWNAGSIGAGSESITAYRDVEKHPTIPRSFQQGCSLRGLQSMSHHPGRQETVVQEQMRCDRQMMSRFILDRYRWTHITHVWGLYEIVTNELELWTITWLSMNEWFD